MFTSRQLVVAPEANWSLDFATADVPQSHRNHAVTDVMPVRYQYSTVMQFFCSVTAIGIPAGLLGGIRERTRGWALLGPAVPRRTRPAQPTG